MRRRQEGFTLIELMVVVTIIAILASFAAPSFRGYIVEARLNEAKPYLLEIASRMRTYKARNGVYPGETLSEDTLTSTIGVDLSSSENFCFVFVVPPAGTNFVTNSEAGDPAPEFEVWAIMRSANAASVTGPKTKSCAVSTSKRPPSGWVATNRVPRQGRAVVYRYPPPPNGTDAIAGANGVRFTWIEGLSTSNAFAP